MSEQHRLEALLAQDDEAQKVREAVDKARAEFGLAPPADQQQQPAQPQTPSLEEAVKAATGLSLEEAGLGEFADLKSPDDVKRLAESDPLRHSKYVFAIEKLAQQYPQPPATAEQLAPELQRALAHPQIRQAVEAQFQQIAAARQQFANAAVQATQFGLAAMIQDFPELRGVPAEQIPIVLETLAKSNPQRGAQAVARIEQIRALDQAGRAAQQQEVQRAQAEL